MTEIQALVARARTSIAAARTLHEGQFYNYAVSRAYYAMFYSASAALLDRGLRFKRHGALVAAFAEQFVKTGALPTHLQMYLSRGFEQRSRGDYQVLEDITEAESSKSIREAEEFVRAVKAYLE